jgi:hypothetical protein
MTIEGLAWDLETNAQSSGQATFKKLIYRKSGGWIKPDERELRELINKHSAILVRNAVFSLIPKDMIEDSVSLAFNNLKTQEKKSPIAESRDKSIKAFASYNLTKKELENYIGKPFEKWDAEIMAQLRGVLSGIKDGDLSVADIKSHKADVVVEKKTKDQAKKDFDSDELGTATVEEVLAETKEAPKEEVKTDTKVSDQVSILRAMLKTDKEKVLASLAKRDLQEDDINTISKAVALDIIDEVDGK